jgi:hypothetical protein
MNFIWVIEWKNDEGEWACYMVDIDDTRKDVRETVRRWNASGIRKYRVKKYVREERTP